jgi:hypothetical protein
VLDGFLLLLRDRAQNVAGTRDVREIDLGLEIVLTVSGTGGGPVRSGRRVGASTEVLAYEFGLVLFERARVSFFLGDADRGQDLKNFSALDLQLARQIVDSNFAHRIQWLAIGGSRLEKSTSRKPIDHHCHFCLSPLPELHCVLLLFPRLAVGFFLPLHQSLITGH